MRRASGWLVTLAVPLALLALNVRFLASEPFLRWEYGRAELASAPGFTDAERMAVAAASTRFIVSGDDRAVLDGLRHDGAILYTRAEVDHLVDVRAFVRRLSLLGTIAALLIVVTGLATALGAAEARRARVTAWRRAVGRGGWFTVGLVLLVGAGIAAMWPLVFTAFHEVFFRPGTWQFPVDSGLIRLFPERFWYDVAVIFSLLTLGEGALTVLVGLGHRGRG